MLSKDEMVRISGILTDMFIGTCTIFEVEKYVRENKTIGFNEKVVYSDVPCRLSFNTNRSVNESADEYGHILEVSQKVKLFLSKDIEVRAGSRISISQNGKTYKYKKSGTGRFYQTHQEISLVLEEFV